MLLNQSSVYEECWEFCGLSTSFLLQKSWKYFLFVKSFSVSEYFFLIWLLDSNNCKGESQILFIDDHTYDPVVQSFFQVENELQTSRRLYFFYNEMNNV